MSEKLWMEFYEETCCNCGCTFFITKKHHQLLVDTKQTFYCPNGHTQSYTGKTDAQKLKEKEEELARITKYYQEERKLSFEKDKTIRELKKAATKKVDKNGSKDTKAKN
jgi:hypothetical protein